MPIETCKSSRKAHTYVRFGIGDIFMCNALMTEHDDSQKRILGMIQDVPGDIGRLMTPEHRFQDGYSLNEEKCVFLVFDNPESVQHLIDQLENLQIALSNSKEELLECLNEKL